MGLHGAAATTALRRENAVHVSSNHPSISLHIERYVDSKAAGDFLGLQALLFGKGDGLLHRSKYASACKHTAHCTRTAQN